ncbi:MAG: SDR family oxidoreductase [Acidimicrobiia bacterium]|nr:SDR family oxidoreductase [Acidimicrobiia bacterium]NNF68373.1 SDR family oxidoreductase [Acidimicrobiia bacterium]
MDIRVDGKAAVVTGASRGIGEAITRELLDSGATGVVITSRKQENLDGAMARLDAGERVVAVAARADDEEDAARAIQTAVDEFGACDIVVANAGTNPSFGPMVSVDLGGVDKTWSVNQRGPLLLARAAWNGWMGENGGAIVNVASIAGLTVSPFMGAYNVSKAALIHLTRQLALEMAPGVRVNAVAPAVVRTKLASALWEHNEDAAANAHPMGRIGEPEDVARAVVFLASEAAGWITGVTVPVDGGVTGAKSAQVLELP